MEGGALGHFDAVPLTATRSPERIVGWCCERGCKSRSVVLRQTVTHLLQLAKNPRYSRENPAFGASAKGSTSPEFEGKTTLRATRVELTLLLSACSANGTPVNTPEFTCRITLHARRLITSPWRCTVYNMPKQRFLMTFHHHSKIVLYARAFSLAACSRPSRRTAVRSVQQL